MFYEKGKRECALPFSMEYHLTFLGRNSMMKLMKTCRKRQKKENDDEENRKISESK